MKTKADQKLAVVILNYCSANDTSELVDNLLSFQRDFHIIVVDNQSPDCSFSFLEKKYAHETNVELIQTSKNLGYARGNNYGIHYALKHFRITSIAIMNPDVRIPTIGIIDNLLSLLWSNENCMYVGGKPIDGLSGKDMPMAWDIPSPWNSISNYCLLKRKIDYLHRKRFVGIGDGIYKVECIAGCFFLARVDYFMNIGFFDENTFLYNEENILGIKSKSHNYYGLVDINQVYYHTHKKNNIQHISFIQKISSTSNSFNSRKYLIARYYSRCLIPLLYISEYINKMYLAFAWIIHFVH